MESFQEEAVMMISNAAGQIVKGKRTKRQRPSSPFNLIDMHASNSWSGDEGYPSPTTSLDMGETTEEEEDMANCLILLAQGHSLYNPKQFDDDVGGAIMDKLRSGPKYAAAYQCKTCNRCFSSFQALGGHRASHKKPKALLEKKTLMLLEDDTNNTTCHLNLQMGNIRSSSYISNNNKSKVHECSICGAEFTSGQALGGHMRRHRSLTANTNTSSMEMMVVPYEPQHQQPATKKPRNSGGLCVDLNLPAPEELDSKFLYSSKQQPLLFSASSLVDCHY